MKIDYNDIDFKLFPEFKGGNGNLHSKMFFDGKNRIMR